MPAARPATGDFVPGPPDTALVGREGPGIEGRARRRPGMRYPGPVRPILCALLVLSPAPAGAGTIRVPDDYPTIAAALAAASAGSLVEIACGTYFEHDLALKPGIVVTSETGQPGCVVIDAEHAGRGFVADGVGGCDLVGVTIRNGVPAASGASGGGFLSTGSTLLVSACTFESCSSTANGGAFHAESSLLRLEGCRFVENLATGWGGALSAVSTETHFLDCDFVGNRASRHGAAYLDGTPLAVFEACDFEGNGADSASGAFGFHDSRGGLYGCGFFGNDGAADAGGATVTGASFLLIQRCTFRGNSAVAGGAVTVGGGTAFVERTVFDGNRTTGGAGARGGALRVGGGNATITRTAFVGNESDTGSHLFLENGRAEVGQCIFAGGVGAVPVGCGSGATLGVGCTDVWGHAGGDWVGCLAPHAGGDGNFSADPLFCDPDAGDFSIRADSPCTEGASGCGLVGPFDVGCVPSPVRPESWARIKGRYR